LFAIFYEKPKNKWRKQMLKRILQLSTCLMIIFALNPAQAMNPGSEQFNLCNEGCKTDNNKMGCCFTCIGTHLQSASSEFQAAAKKQCQDMYK
jgi:hypothetical protein